MCCNSGCTAQVDLFSSRFASALSSLKLYSSVILFLINRNVQNIIFHGMTSLIQKLGTSIKKRPWNLRSRHLTLYFYNFGKDKLTSILDWPKWPSIFWQFRRLDVRRRLCLRIPEELFPLTVLIFCLLYTFRCPYVSKIGTTCLALWNFLAMVVRIMVMDYSFERLSICLYFLCLLVIWNQNALLNMSSIWHICWISGFSSSTSEYQTGLSIRLPNGFKGISEIRIRRMLRWISNQNQGQVHILMKKV